LQLFYSTNTTENQLILEEEEHRHVLVLRKNIGDVLEVTDGKGSHHKVTILDVKKQQTICQIESTTNELLKEGRYIHLLIAPTKQIDRIEWMFEKLVEMGAINEITFIKTKYTERSNLNNLRFQKIAISAIKQSLQFYLPKINQLIDFKTALNEVGKSGINLIGHCYSGIDKESLDKIQLSEGELVNVWIGPEGDFSEEEVKAAIQHNMKTIDLGKERLRTETAGLKSVMVLKSIV
jgi:16S rRNA (uracil1498-N3)-methyltransferase